MALRVLIHNATGRYPARLTDRISRVIARAEAGLEEQTVLPTIDMAVFLSPHGIHPDYAMTGMMMARDSCHITINPDHPRFANDGEADLFTCVVHEVHHCLRSVHSPLDTLADIVALEGLAMATEREMGCSTELWDAERPASWALRRKLARVAAAPETRDFSWINGQPRGKRINWIYYLGDEIVGSWLNKTGHTSFSAIETPSAAILAASPALERFRS